jgi:glycosyltransferase involved in cell wall biosynthesis
VILGRSRSRSLRPHPPPQLLLAVLAALNGGGAERVTLNLLKSIAARNLRVGLLSFVECGPLRQFLAPAVESHVLGTASLRRSLVPMISTIRRLRPAIVFSTLGYVNVAILALRVLFPRGTRIWIREANLPSISLPNNKFPRLMRWAYVVLYRRSDLLICSSARMKDEFVREFGVPAKKIRVLANPVDEMLIRQHAISMALLGAPGRRFVAAGRLTRQKGFDRLLEMFANLGDEEAELVVLGEGPLETPLKQQAIALGVSSRVRFEGFTDNPWVWFASADGFLLPSRWEGMPNAALEALACGLPVIATPESGGIAEVAAIAEPGAVQVVAVGKPFIEAMRKVPFRPKDTLPPSLLPPQYQLESVVDTFVSLLSQID